MEDNNIFKLKTSQKEFEEIGKIMKENEDIIETCEIVENETKNIEEIMQYIKAMNERYETYLSTKVDEVYEIYKVY